MKITPGVENANPTRHVIFKFSFVLMAFSVLLVAACGPQGSVTADNAAGEDMPTQEDDDDDAASFEVLSVTYGIYHVEGDTRDHESTHTFITQGRTRWLDIVVDSSSRGAVLGSWQANDSARTASGVLNPEGASAERRGDDPESLAPPDDLFDDDDLVDYAESFLEDSIDVHSLEADTQAVDPETGEESIELSSGEAPNALMNRRFSADDETFDGIEAMEDISHALRTIRPVIDDGASDGSALLRAIAEDLDRDLGVLRLTALEDVQCDTCHDMLSVWDEGLDIPLLAFELDPDGTGYGLVVHELVLDRDDHVALLDRLTESAFQ